MTALTTPPAEATREPTPPSPQRVRPRVVVATAGLLFLFAANAVASTRRVGFYDDKGSLSSSERLIVVTAALLLLVALVSAVAQRPRETNPVLAPVAVLAVLLLFNRLTGFAPSPVEQNVMSIMGIVIVALAPYLRLRSSREVFLFLLPIFGTCAISVLDVLGLGAGSYLFGWYNQWALAGAILVGSALTRLPMGTRFRIACLVVGGLSVALSTSRQGLLAVMLAVAFAVLTTPSFHRRAQLLIVGSLGGAATWISVSGSERLSGLDGGVADSHGRSTLWNTGIELASQTPWIGYSDPSQPLYQALNSKLGGFTVSTHNFLLDSMVAGGVVGLLAAVWFIVRWFTLGLGPHLGSHWPLLGVALPFMMLGANMWYPNSLDSSIVVGTLLVLSFSCAPPPDGLEVPEPVRKPRW